MAERSLYLIRHGEIVKPNGKVFVGMTDFPLNIMGMVQGRALGEYFKNKNIEAIYCSSLQRSLYTAQIIAWAKNMQPLIAENIKEINLGEWDGKTFSEIADAYPEEFMARGKDIINYKIKGAESFYECSIRVIIELEKILKNTKGDIVIVGHSGVNRIILCHLLKIDLKNLFNFKQDYGCINEIIIDEGGCYLNKLNKVS